MVMVKCLCCNKILISRHQHDFVRCLCENGTFVDGGGEYYYRIGGNDLSMALDFRKHDNNVDRGKAARRNGISMEKKLVELIDGWGFDIKRVPMSGSLKMVKGLEEFKGDVVLRLADNDYRIEVKRKQDAGRWYALVNKGCVHIDGFCYFMTQAQFAELIHGIDFGIVSVVPDVKFKRLHGFFDQDDADIVVVGRPYCNFIFAVTEKAFENIKKTVGGN